jgi:predicted nucleic acid-binding protein
MSVVLDASMAIGWLFTDEWAEAGRLVLRRVATEGALVPSLWRLEVANVLRNAIRRGRCDAGYADRCLSRLSRLPISVDGETDAQAWSATRRLSNAHDLTLYDAAYLELAMRRTRPLATRDADLVKAATAAGLEVLTC